jgi:spermidine synthase
MAPLIALLFFLSGAAGLTYQVLWMRSLGLFFGSDMYGVSIILSAFMGGLALGGLLGGGLAERSGRPLRWYGLAELGIGALALGFAPLLAALAPWLRGLYPEASGSLGYQAARVLLAVAALLPPTALMGATLPLVVKAFVRRGDVVGRIGAHFYAVNTLGALVGTLAVGFVLLPRLGMTGTTLCAAAVNLAIGAVCLVLGGRSPAAPAAAPAPAGAVVSDDPLPGLEPEARRRLAVAALLAIALSGFASFALEVVWTRILIASFSATVYSFASMLACFLFGIFLGSRLVGPEVDRHPNPVALFARLELGAALSVAVLCLLVNAVPGLFGRLMSGVTGVLGEAGREHALVVSTLIASFTLLVIPTTLIGATFPVALRVYTRSAARVGAGTGRLYAANTGGAIGGSLVAGLLAVPWLGARVSLAGVAILFAGVGLLLVRAQGPLPGRVPGARAALLAGVAALLAGASLLAPYRATLNFNQRAEVGARVVFHADGVQSSIDVIRSPSGATALAVGGNVEADDSEAQRRHFVLKGHLPLLWLEQPRTVLVIGLGMGITLRSTARHPGIERIEVVELSPEIVEAQAYLKQVNDDVLSDPRIHVRIDDGRIFTQLTDRHYDMITADPIHPKISRVGYLYTREYYASIGRRLNPGGVVCQWMPMYQISPRRLRSAIATFVDVYPAATLWHVPNHLLLVAAPEPLDYRRVVSRLEDPQVREDLASIGIDSAEALLGHLLMGPEEIRAYLDEDPEVPLNTDDHPYLEYFVPGDLYARSADNLRELAPHAADPARYVDNVPADVAARLRSLRRAWTATQTATSR